MHEVAIQAELLALNSALDADGADQASEALHRLSRDLRQARAQKRDSEESVRVGWRIIRSA